MPVGSPGTEAGIPQKYVVKLTAGERERLRSMVHSGRESARALTRARVLLKCDEGCTDEEAADAVDTSLGTVGRARKRFCTGGPEAALPDRPQPPRPAKRRVDGEARPVSLACSTPPDGRESWTLELLAGRMVRLRFVEGALSGQTVRRVLEKRDQALAEGPVVHRAGAQSAEFVWHMEDVPGVYKRPHDPRRPVAGLGEKSAQLVADVRDPLPAAPGVARRRDHEYKRKGTADVSCACEPPGNWRKVRVTDRRTRVDRAHFVRDPVDAPRYAGGEAIVLVMDPLDTHTPASLYEAFEPATGQAHRRQAGDPPHARARGAG
jgi:hypothetical protein